MIGILLVFFIVVLLVTMRYGAQLIVAPEPRTTQEMEVAVVLLGSYDGERARNAAAIRMLREGQVSNVLLSVGAVMFWGEWMPDLVRDHFKRTYGDDLMARIDLCESVTDSTWEEALALRKCLDERGWRSVLVVTSNYHTRRAGVIWRAAVADVAPPITLTVRGVSDGSFEVDSWWRNRKYAKTWLLETCKLIWWYIERPLGWTAL